LDLPKFQDKLTLKNRKTKQNWNNFMNSKLSPQPFFPHQTTIFRARIYLSKENELILDQELVIID